MPASRAPALGEPSRGLSRRQPGDGSRWDGALAARRRGGGEASLAGCARQRERPAGILPATAAASCDSRPSRCGDFLLARLSCEHAGISRGRSSVPKAQCGGSSGVCACVERHTRRRVECSIPNPSFQKANSKRHRPKLPAHHLTGCKSDRPVWRSGPRTDGPPSGVRLFLSAADWCGPSG